MLTVTGRVSSWIGLTLLRSSRSAVTLMVVSFWTVSPRVGDACWACARPARSERTATAATYLVDMVRALYEGTERRRARSSTSAWRRARRRAVADRGRSAVSVGIASGSCQRYLVPGLGHGATDDRSETGCYSSAVAGGPFAKGSSRSGSACAGRAGAASSERRGCATTSATRSVPAIGAAGRLTAAEQSPMQVQ